MVKELQTIDMENVKLYMNIGTIIWLIGLAVWFWSYKTELDLFMKQDKVSTTDFAVLKTDVTYIKSELWAIRALLEKKG